MYTFAQLFQTKVTSTSQYETVTQETLDDAIDAVATAQVEVIPSRVKAIVTQIIKENQLWVRPIIAMLDGKPHLVSGRHRYVAAQQICAEYGISESGKLQKLALNESGSVVYATTTGLPLTPIACEIEVEVLTVASAADLAHLQLCYNGSRSMTSAEKILVEEQFKKVTALQRAKMALAKKLEASIGVTLQTGLAMATCINAQIKTLAYATPDQLDEIDGFVSEWMGENVDYAPSNLARQYKHVILGDDTDDKPYEGVMEMLIAYTDDEGEECQTTVLEYLKATVTKPEKASRSSSADQIAQLQAKIAELMAKQA